jgi:hypothetical protein
VKLLRISTAIMPEPRHALSQGGYAAAMGSKNLAYLRSKIDAISVRSGWLRNPLTPGGTAVTVSGLPVAAACGPFRGFG